MAGQIRIPYSGSVGVPPADTAILYAHTSGSLRVRLPDGSDYPVGVGASVKSVPVGKTMTILEDQQHIVYGAFRVEGTVRVLGELVVL